MLETGYEIITLWVSRMVMMSFFALDEIPFEKVYLHGMVLDKNGKKMSKSRGNGIDPLDMIGKYGADATRLALLVGSTPGNDIRFSEEKVEGCRNLVNKLWNIARFIFTTRDSSPVGHGVGMTERLRPATLADRWILSRLNNLKLDVGKFLDEYNFSAAGELLREFMWNDFADWYLEIAKVEGNKGEILSAVLSDLLKLWHPFMPFVTEAIWSSFERPEMASLIVAEWPKADKNLIDKKAEKEFVFLQEVIVKIRNLRAEQKVEPGKKVDVSIKNSEGLVEASEIIRVLAKVENLTFVSEKPQSAAGAIVGKTEIYLLLAGLVDIEKEKERLEKEVASIGGYVESLEKKLGNAEFVKNAPQKVVDENKARLAEAREKLAKLEEQLNELKK
jgi:valyl-tRNA synthetase